MTSDVLHLQLATGKTDSSPRSQKCATSNKLTDVECRWGTPASYGVLELAATAFAVSASSASLSYQRAQQLGRSNETDDRQSCTKLCRSQVQKSHLYASRFLETDSAWAVILKTATHIEYVNNSVARKSVAVVLLCEDDRRRHTVHNIQWGDAVPQY